MILKGFIGTVYVRIEEDYRIDLWRSGIWLKPDDVAVEMLEEKLDILLRLAADSEDYGGYNSEEGENDPDNEGYFESFEKMLTEIRSRLNEGDFDDPYEDVEITISSLPLHIPQMTEYEWARICESQAL